MKKCIECGASDFKECFVADESGPLYYVDGSPSLKNQLFGKKKKMKMRVCKACGHASLFCDMKK